MKRGGWIQRKTPLRSKTPPRRFHKPRRAPLPRRRTARAIRRQNGLWSCDTADKAFSKWIRARDGKCMRCGITQFLTCSHYWMRSHSGTRFDPDNCDALCMGPGSNHCHDEWEKRKNYEYREFKLKQLGQERYDALERRARTYKERKEAVAECKAMLSSFLH